MAAQLIGSCRGGFVVRGEGNALNRGSEPAREDPKSAGAIDNDLREQARTRIVRIRALPREGLCVSKYLLRSR